MWWIPLILAALMGAVGFHAYRSLEQTTRAQLRRELQTILHADLEALRLWVESAKSIARSEAAAPALLEAVGELRRLARTAVDARGALLESSAGRRVRSFLKPVLWEHQLHDYAVLDPSGLVLADGSGVSVGRRLGLEATALEEVLSGSSTFTRASAVADAVEGAFFHSAAPILDAEARVVAILVFAVPADRGFTEILQVARMGESGETYAFDAQGRMLSESRFVDQLVGLGLLPEDPAQRRSTLIQIRDPGGSLLEGHVPELPLRARPLTRMAADAVSGGSGTDVEGYRDYRGIVVIGAWAWLPELGLGVTTEIDRAEAYVGLDSLRWSFYALAAVLALAAVGILFYSVVLGRLQRRFERARRLGHYHIVEKIGEGGMGKVYRARHALLRRPTAVKLFDASEGGQEAVRRFEREVQSTSSLTHPNTISIYDYGHTPDGTFYYAMEYLDGLTLGQLVSEDGPQPEARVMHVMRQVAASLAEAHAAGLVHRDLKPSNVMLCTRGGMLDFAKVLDFGLVRGVEQTEDVTVTSVKSLTGTPLYLSPEALEAPERVSPRSDVYQLGAITYYLLSGRHVFGGESLVEVLSALLHKTPVAPSELLGHPLSPDLEELVLSCLEKDPSRRPADGAALLEALEHCRIDAVWTQRDARAWWAERAERRERKGAESGEPSGTLPSGWDIDLSSRAGSRFR